jgi:hypothetical protein
VAVTCFVALFLILEPQRWKNPARTWTSLKGTFKFQSSAFDYELGCQCPEVAIEGQNVSLPFTLKLIAKQNVPSAVPTPTILIVHAGSTPVTLGTETLPGSINFIPIRDPISLRSGEELTIPIPVSLVGVTDDLSQISFVLDWESAGASEPQAMTSIAWPISARPTFKTFVLPIVYSAAVLLAGAGLFVGWLYRLRRLRERTERKLAEAQSKAAANPEAARFAWDLARVKLEAYFDRNLIQVNLVFWVSSIVMGAGFCFVLIGVWFAYRQPKEVTPSLVAAVAGVLTQFIGATFMVIYRSIMAQANDFMTVLERINSVGMAVQVLDALKEGTQLKDDTRAQIATLLLQSVPPARRSPGSATRPQRPSAVKDR